MSSEVTADLLVSCKLKEVYIDSYGFTRITAMAIIYMFYLLFYSLVLYLTFSIVITLF